MPRRYTAKRATKRWLENAPVYILACYDSGPNGGADRYTFIYGGPMQEGDGTFGGAWFHALGTSVTGHVSGSFEFKAHELSTYRYSKKHHLIRWKDIPEVTRILARRWAETDNANNISAETMAKIRADEREVSNDPDAASERGYASASYGARAER